jgi:hypothetical protein
MKKRHLTSEKIQDVKIYIIKLIQVSRFDNIDSSDLKYLEMYEINIIPLQSNLI